MPYYAVLVGRKTGVYDTWMQCQEQTAYYSGSVFKKFDTLGEAVRYYSKHYIPDNDAKYILEPYDYNKLPRNPRYMEDVIEADMKSYGKAPAYRHFC